MNTREEILKLGDALIREKGFNAFSFSDISKELGIKNASIHYHFATKNELGVAVIKENLYALQKLIEETKDKSPLEKLKAFLTIYTTTKEEGRVCLVGSLGTDLHTVDDEMKGELKMFVDKALHWMTDILKEGREKKQFNFPTSPRTKALLVITNMMAAVQLVRLTKLTGSKNDFDLIKKEVIADLTRSNF